MGPDRQRLALAGLVLEAGEICLARRLVAEAQPRRFGERPFERGMAALRARGALPRPRRCLGPLAQAAVGHAGLHTGAAL